MMRRMNWQYTIVYLSVETTTTYNKTEQRPHSIGNESGVSLPSKQTAGPWWQGA